MTKIFWFFFSKKNAFLSFLQRHRPRGRSLVLFLIPFALLYGILAGLRWPMLWATSHMVFDYHFGLGKRGLVGFVLGLIAPPPYHYVTLARIGFAVFALWLALLAIASWRSARRDTGIAAAFVFAFLSAGFASLVCDIGYFEHVGLVLTLVCLLLPPGLVWAPLRAALMLAAVFAHEGNFLMFVPVVLFDVLVSRPKLLDWRSLIAAVLTMVPAAAATAYLGNVRTACNHAAAIAYFQSKVRDFPIRDDAVETLCRNGDWNFHMLWIGWRSGGPVFFLSLALIVVLPSALFNLALVRSMGERKWPITVLAAGAVFSPIALNFLGGDLVRFTSLIQITSLLVLVALARRRGVPEGGSLPVLLRSAPVLITLACYELSSSLVLTDLGPMMKFPFVPVLQRLFFVLHGDEKFLIIPPS